MLPIRHREGDSLVRHPARGVTWLSQFTSTSTIIGWLICNCRYICNFRKLRNKNCSLTEIISIILLKMTPLMISGTPVERVSSFKYLGVEVFTEDPRTRDLFNIVCNTRVDRRTLPVTMVTSVPWERERDITEISPLWELLPFNLSWSPIGSRQSNDWPIVAKHANMTSSRQYKCDARDNYIRIGYWNRRLG